jgi:hypothetical protein
VFFFYSQVSKPYPVYKDQQVPVVTYLVEKAQENQVNTQSDNYQGQQQQFGGNGYNGGGNGYNDGGNGYNDGGNGYNGGSNGYNGGGGGNNFHDSISNAVSHAQGWKLKKW